MVFAEVSKRPLFGHRIDDDTAIICVFHSYVGWLLLPLSCIPLGSGEASTRLYLEAQIVNGEKSGFWKRVAAAFGPPIAFVLVGLWLLARA